MSAFLGTMILASFEPRAQEKAACFDAEAVCIQASRTPFVWVERRVAGLNIPGVEGLPLCQFLNGQWKLDELKVSYETEFKGNRTGK